MDYKKLQDLKDRLDKANSAIASVSAHITTMREAAKYVGVFEHALSDLEIAFEQTVRNTLHQLEVDLYDFIREHAPDVVIKNTRESSLTLFGKFIINTGQTHTLTWSERYSGRVRDLIDKGHLSEVTE